MSSDLSGQILNHYQLMELLGKGGMAVVYRARQTNIERHVAIKIMANSLTSDEDFFGRFKHEADLIAKLEHPNILPIYDYGSTADYFYIVLRLMEGGSLDEYMAGHALPPNEVDRLLRQIASALDFAHQHRVVHRDLKPNNVLLDRLGNAYLMDFGIAKVISDSTLTTTSTIMGTPGYMAPEQWKLTPFDHRIDIYSLGIMTYEMLTGSTPFIGQTPLQYMYAHLHEQIPRPSNFVQGLPAEVDKVLLRATAKDPKRRYFSAGEFAEAFSAALRGEKVTADGVPISPKSSRGVRPAKNALEDVLVELELSPEERRSPSPKLDKLLDTPSQQDSSGVVDEFGLEQLLEDVMNILDAPAQNQAAASPHHTEPLPEIQVLHSDLPPTLPHIAAEPPKSESRIPAIRLHDLLAGLEDMPSRSGQGASSKAIDLIQSATTSNQKATPKRSEKVENLLTQLEQPAEKKLRVHLNVMDLLSYGGKRQRSLGINAQQVRLPPTLESQLGQSAGLMLLGVDTDGPAERAGLFLGDILITADGQPLRHLDDLSAILSNERDRLNLQLVRAGQLHEISLEMN